MPFDPSATQSAAIPASTATIGSALTMTTRGHLADGLGGGPPAGTIMLRPFMLATLPGGAEVMIDCGDIAATDPRLTAKGMQASDVVGGQNMMAALYLVGADIAAAKLASGDY